MHDRGVRGFGLGLSLGAASSAILSPTVLFGENLTVEHNVQNLDMMFQDYVGTPAVVGSSVALQLDSAQGERRTILGPEIRDTGTVGMTGTATAATYDTVTGEGTANRVDSSNLSHVAFSGVTVGRPYFIDVENTGANSIQIQDTSTSITTLTTGQRRTVFVPAITTDLRVQPASAGTTSSFTVHSVKECLGTPRYQTTSAQRPILGRHPKGGRRNLVLHTENLTSGWGGATTKTIAAETYNGSPFTTVTKTTASTSEAAAQAVGVLTGGQPYTITCAFLAGTVTACQLGIHNPTDVWGASSVAVEVIEGPGAAGFSGSLFTLSGLSSTVPTVVRLTFTKATTASSTINLYPQSSGSTTIGHSVKVTRFQLEPGSVATAYQAVTTTYDCTEAGVPDCYYLQADGSDDGMVTPTLDLNGITSDGQAVRNLLKASDNLTDAVWVKQSATTPFVDKIVVNKGVALGSGTAAGVRQSFTKAASALPYVWTLEAKADEFNRIHIYMATSTTSTRILVSLVDGSIVGSPAGTGSLLSTLGYSISSVGDGWYAIQFSGTTDTDTNLRVDYWPADSVATTGNGSSGIRVRKSQLELGSTATAYQARGTDKIAVFTGVRKLSDAASAVIMELSATSSTNAGVFAMFAPSTVAANYAFRSAGSSLAGVINPVTTYTAPHTAVLSGIGNIAAPSNTIRVNGANETTLTDSQGTGNFGSAYPLYYFRRGGSSLPFNGLEYGNFIVATLPDAAQIAAGEAFQNNYIGAY